MLNTKLKLTLGLAALAAATALAQTQTTASTGQLPPHPVRRTLRHSGAAADRL